MDQPDKPKSLAARILDVDIYVACLALAVLIAITVSGVAMRYIVNRPLHWLEEVQLWCFVWVVFAGASYVARQNVHILIDAIVMLFSPGMRRAATTIASLATVAALSFLCYYSSMHVLQMHARNRLTNILGIPFSLIYAVVPLSCLVIVLAALWRLVHPKSAEAARESA